MGPHRRDGRGGKGRPLSCATDVFLLKGVGGKIRVCRKVCVSLKQDKLCYEIFGIN